MSVVRSQKTLFRLEDVTCLFGEVEALKNVQLTIESGELLFITGLSGAGKTTLLRVLTGDLEPTHGKVQRATHSLYGQDLFIAPIFQDLRLIDELTCEENLYLAYDSSLYESKRDFQKELQELCSIFGMTDRLRVKVSSANGGLKQKVAIVRALLTRPDVLVADEPSSALDFESTRKVFDVLQYYNSKKGMTVIWASHNRELVKQFTGRIAHIDKGRLVYSGHACFI